MSISPTIADVLAALFLDEKERQRSQDIHFRDAGHGYDAFGMHPSFVALGQLLVAPLYDKYFRVRSHGHENIPSSGPAVLAANHSGNLPIDGMMIWLDVVRNSDPPRVPRPIADHFVPSLPYLGTLFARGGLVGGSRGNARSLLDAGEMLMIFPEGVPGIVKPFSERYQLQHFREGHAELAIRHGAPIIPIGVVGAEEQMPAMFTSRTLGKLFGVPILPIPIVPVPLPVRYHLYYGEPIPVHKNYKPKHADDPSVVAEVAEQVKSAVDALIRQGLSERQGVFE
ncbi:MAG: glycerol acyltransferase [Deltaproteobacteria bacterium]|nr:glycerol acyltransferase [Deltaproteobacteria bacterium]